MHTPSRCYISPYEKLNDNDQEDLPSLKSL